VPPGAERCSTLRARIPTRGRPSGRHAAIRVPGEGSGQDDNMALQPDQKKGGSD